MPNSQKKLSTRLFFALWPDDAVREKLIALRQSYLQDKNCRPTHVDNLHMTLVFLGNIPLDKVDYVVAGADKVQASSFTLHVDSVCAWQHNSILWAGVSQIDEKALQLAKTLRQVVRNCDLNVEKRTWQPHITLARRYPQGPTTPVMHEAFAWRVSDFV